MGSITQMIDYSASVAARVQGVLLPDGTPVGVRAVHGSGNAGIANPLLPGHLIDAAPEKPREQFCHVSEIPDAPSVIPVTMDGLAMLEWSIPMRLYVPRGNLATVRQTLLPFYEPYWDTFWADHTLGGLCNLAYIRSFKPDGDDDWCWLDMDLYVQVDRGV